MFNSVFAFSWDTSECVVFQNVCNGNVLGDTNGVFVDPGVWRRVFLEEMDADWFYSNSRCVDTLLLYYLFKCLMSDIGNLSDNWEAMERYCSVNGIYALCGGGFYCNISGNVKSYVLWVQGNAVDR